MASYPSATKSFTTKIDGAGHTILAAHVNDLQDEVVAVENGLISGLAHDLKFTDDTYDIGKTGATRPRDLFLSRDVTIGRNATVAGTLGVTGAATFSSTLSVGGVLTATAQPRASAYNTAVQSVSDATITALTLNAEDYDVGGLHSTSTFTSRMTIPTGGDGLYFLLGSTTFAADADGYRQLYFRLNGTTDLTFARQPAASAGTATLMQVVLHWNLVATDYIELMVIHTAGNALNVGAAGTGTESRLQIVKLW